MTYFSLHISRIHKDLEDIRRIEENKKNTDKKNNFKPQKTKIKKNGSIDDFMKIQWPWLF
tara:strand:+ start:48 stop:227 length:180 start_codon:yes stop_codon:yes gene_type:complete